MIVNRDLSSLSANKNLKSNAQSNNKQLKRSYANQSDTFQSNKSASKDPSFGAIAKRTFVENLLRGGDSFPELTRGWAVDAAFDLAKKTEKIVPSLKKTAQQLEKKAQKAIQEAFLTKDEALKIEEVAPSTIKEAKATSIELKLKSKNKKPKPVEIDPEEEAKPIVLTKKDKKRLSKDIADKLGVIADEKTLKAIKSIMAAKIGRVEAETAQKSVPVLKERAKKLKEAVDAEITKEIMAERRLKKARASKTSHIFQNIKTAIANFFPSKKKA